MAQAPLVRFDADSDDPSPLWHLLNHVGGPRPLSDRG